MVGTPFFHCDEDVHWEQQGATFVFIRHWIAFGDVVNMIAGLIPSPWPSDAELACSSVLVWILSASSHIRLTANKLSLGVTPPSPQDCWDKLQCRLYCECRVQDERKGMDGWSRLNWNIIFHGKKKNIRENTECFSTPHLRILVPDLRFSSFFELFINIT